MKQKKMLAGSNKIIIFEMQGNIIKELNKLHSLNHQLADYLKKIIQKHQLSLSLSTAQGVASSLIANTCQTRNLLHYKHLDDRTTAEKCLLLALDLLTKLIQDHPELTQHIIQEVLTHVQQHPSCFVSLAFLIALAQKHRELFSQALPVDRLRKVLQRVVANFQEAGQIKFFKQLPEEPISHWQSARESLQAHLSKRFKPVGCKQPTEEVSVSQAKIPPLILPSSKSIQSSRYSAISKEERMRGVGELRELASAIGQGFIAVELGCLLAHKRTQQVQQFSNNSDYRNKCLEKIETDRLLSSRLSMMDSSYNQTRTGFDRHMDDTNRRYYKKVLILQANLIHLALSNAIQSPLYSTDSIKPFLLDFMELATVGIFDPWQSPNPYNDSLSGDYFTMIELDLKSIDDIMREWAERVSFIGEKRHLRVLWNRNKRNMPYHYQQQQVERDLSDDFMTRDIKVVRSDHLKIVNSPLKNCKRDEDNVEMDFVIAEIRLKMNQLFTLCDMGNARFYKYEVNLLVILANYLNSSFSNTTQYIAIDLLFPLLILIKRQILQLSHPFLDNLYKAKLTSSFGKSSKKERWQYPKSVKYENPLFALYPDLMCNYLLVISNLMSNHKHVQKLISTVFIKNVIFMETLQRYVEYLFENDLNKQIKKILHFYRKCLEIYNQRKLRNQESKSIKILFNHLSCFFYPKAGCVAKKLEEKEHLISSSPDINQNTIEQHHFLHQLLDFVREIYYYSQDELSENLLQEDVASFYIKYSLINFIKLYSFITVSELVNLQAQGYELTTKESPHISYHPNINTVYMIDFIRIITSISINRTQEISKKIKQYRILQFFIREFELEFEVAENIEKYIRKVNKIVEVPAKTKKPQPPTEQKPSKSKIPPLNLKSTKFKTSVSPVKEEEQRSEQRKTKVNVPSLKLPTRSDRSEGKEQRGVLDSLIQEINQKPKKSSGMQLNLQLTKLNLNKASESNPIAGSSQRNLIYSSERKIRKIYSNKTLHSEAILLVLSLLLNKGLLDSQYCDQFPITHGKINALYILHHHLNEESNRSVIPILAEAVGRIKPYLSGQRLLKLLSTSFTDLSHYKNWVKISAGAYGVIYGCQTNIEEPHEVAIKEMTFPKSIYQRCVLHDIFTEITCLQNFRLDERVTTMYNYGVVSNSYIIVMKKYDCSLRDWILKHREELHDMVPQILKIFWDVLHIILLLHQKSVTHYDIKADNILLQLNSEGLPNKVVLGDFGECRIYDNTKEQLDMKSRGTQCIKSPEMLTLALHLKKESDNYDRRKKIGTTRASDIWSLGCLFYEMLTGQYLYHRADWVNFYIQVTSSGEELLTQSNLEKLQQYSNQPHLMEYLKSILIREPNHRPQIKGAIQKFKDLFGDMREPPPANKSSVVIQKDLEILVGKYIQQLKREEEKEGLVSSVSSVVVNSQTNHNNNRVRGVHFLNSYNNSRSNKFMRIMEDIFFCENINLSEGGYQKIKELKITHIITTNSDPLLSKFSTIRLQFNSVNLAHLAFRLAPKISDLLRQVLLLKGRLLFINDETNYATNLLIYTLSYWFRCSVYETWCLINTQILLFPTFTSDLLSLSAALRLLNDVEERVEQLPKLQCICGSVTLILKEVVKPMKKVDLSCKCRRKKINEYQNMQNGPECVSTGCSGYLQFVNKRYSILWQSIKWASISRSTILSGVFPGKSKDAIKTQVLLNASEPWQNMVDSGSCIKTCRVYSCRLCEMMMLATTESKDQILIVMNNMLRRIRQGIMIPNVQESYGKKTPALSYYTLTKLHLTKGPQQ